MMGHIYLLSEPEAVILGDDLNLYRVESWRYRARKPGDRVRVSNLARREGTLRTAEEIRRFGETGKIPDRELDDGRGEGGV